ncbi:hypothetical protein CVT24_000039 [Panaeolus cyanescens]|uniref:Uncharacterized protein n=1 Tax=Panaeolus cyanescens TaxID=181874 RepID=A0A409W7D4_9AGAR|nr:hypothetical protein CVT24_000039 [Panaeolus cyanescens]
MEFIRQASVNPLNAIRQNIRVIAQISTEEAFLATSGTYPYVTNELAYAQYRFDIQCPDKGCEDGSDEEFLEVYRSIRMLEDRHYHQQSDKVTHLDKYGRPCIRLRQFIFTPYTYSQQRMTRNDVVPPVPACTWNVSPNMDEALASLEDTHKAHCLRAFDENGFLMSPNEIAERLPGRNVEVVFKLLHCPTTANDADYGYLLAKPHSVVLL